MIKNRHGESPLATLLSFFGLALFWLFFAPTQIGGQAIYVMVNGNSMEPGFHFGDLVILHTTNSYQVGDVAAYRDVQLQSFVIHRIIAVEPAYFVFKGDHNFWIDGYHPTRQELIGKLWIHIPKAGLYFQRARSPINIAIISGIIGGFLMLTSTQTKSRPGKTSGERTGQGGVLEGPLLVLGFLALVFLVLGVFAFTKPARVKAAPIPYQQMGAFFYSAAGPAGIYDTATVSSGEPVFLKLTCAINLGFVYNLAAAQPGNIAGSGQLIAKVVDEQSGWERTLPLGSASTFTGTSYTLTASLDLCQVEALVASVEQATGFHASTYTLTIMNQTTVAGTLSGQAFHTIFEPQLAFRFDALHFFLISDNSQDNPLQVTQAGSVANPALVDSPFPLPGLTLTVTLARTFSVIGLGLSLLGLAALGLYFYGQVSRGEGALISVKYGSLIVDVYDRGVETISPVIDITSMDDLAKIAERQNSMILHMVRNQVHYYLVQNNGTTYRYYTDGQRKADALRPAGQKVPLRGAQ
ncbi:MAG TPA: signal peptidase I [Anaerolineales bacterium]|nr:signal peptidase I [Anaerolineales bacterium]